MIPIDEAEFAAQVKKIQQNSQKARWPEKHDPAQHPRAADHSAFINRVSASVSSPRPVDATPVSSNRPGKSDFDRLNAKPLPRR